MNLTEQQPAMQLQQSNTPHNKALHPTAYTFLAPASGGLGIVPLRAVLTPSPQTEKLLPLKNSFQR